MAASSKYEVIWQKLKADKHCAIAAPIPLHARIIKAVIKRKDVDVGYKLQLLDKRKKVRLSHICESSRVRFFLTEYDSSLKNIDIGEL